MAKQKYEMKTERSQKMNEEGLLQLSGTVLAPYVVIGEYGAVNKENTPERVKWFSAFIKYSRFHGMTSCLWDNGDYRITKTSADKYSEKLGFYDRRKQVWFFPEILEAIMTNVGE